MPKFFVPFADAPEQAERVYGAFVKNSVYPLSNPKARLFSVAFPARDRGRNKNPKPLIAEVGKEIVGWPEPAGVVLGIVETPQLLTIHTHLRGGLSATPIMVSPEQASARVYFDDFPNT